MSERLIVIGGGGAGTAAATIAKRLKPDLHVSVFTEFEDIAYSPCGIPFVHGGEIPRFEDLFLSTVERYVADGLDMRMETVVTDIDLDRRIVTARNQHEGFDQLVICTGFTWEKPSVPGANLEGLHYVKNIRKAMEFDKLLDQVKRVAVVGATPARGRDGGQPRPPRPRGRLHRRGAVGARRGARPRHRRAGPRVARGARRDAAPGHQGRGLRRRRPRARGRHLGGRAALRHRDRVPGEDPEHGAGGGRRARGRHHRRPGGRRPHAHEGARRLRGRRRDRGAARPDHAPDPRA